MRALLFALVAISSSLSASSKEGLASLNAYLNLFKQHETAMGPLGDHAQGEIEVLIKPEMIQKVQDQMRLRLIAKGYSEEEATKYSRVGIIAEDNYWMWIRDAVIFPSGVHGTYDRLFWKSGLDGQPGVAILPVLPTKKIVLNVSYRHATRNWELELPRGQRNPKETCEKAVARELQEETGYLSTKCSLLGTITLDSGTLAGDLPVYLAEAHFSGENSKEYSEAIIQNPAFTKEELKQGLLRGYIEIPIHGTLTKVLCRDPVLSYALLLTEMRHEL